MIGGVELRKQRNLGDIVSDAFTILFAAWKPLAMIVIPVVAFTVATQLILYAVGDDISDAIFAQEEFQEKVEDYVDRLDADADAAWDWDISPISVIVLAASVLIGFILTVLTSAALVSYLDRSDRGEQVTSADALDDAQDRLGPLIGATLRAALICFLLAITVIGIPFAIYRAVRWIFISQVVMVEGIRGHAVLARSAELIQGKWWNTVGRLIVTALVIQIPTGILSSALTAAFPGVVGILLTSAIGFVTTPFGIIASSLMFFDLFVRKAPQPNADVSPA